MQGVEKCLSLSAHIVMVLSSDPEASWLPSGLRDTDNTGLECPVRVRWHFHAPLDKDHILMVLSCDPEAAGGQAIKPSRYGPYLAGRAHLLESENEKLSELCDLDLVT